MEPGHNGFVESCRPVRHILSRIGDKWSVLVVLALRGGSLRFNEVKRALGTVSQRMLTLTLRSMERDGLVTRTVTPTNPPRVDYALTPLGRSLIDMLEALGRWALEHHDTIETARKRFDRLNGTPAGTAGAAATNPAAPGH